MARRGRREAGGETSAAEGGSGLQRDLVLPFHPPWDWSSLLAFLGHRAIPGVEKVTANSYARSFVLAGVPGHILARFSSDSRLIRVTVCHPAEEAAGLVVGRLRSVFDLDADSARIDGHLGGDPLLKPMVRRFPGLRVPGCWSGFELAVRAVLGQQVTVKAAATLVARVAARYGQAYDCAEEGLNHTFPEPALLQEADLSGMGIVGQRIAAIHALAALLDSGELSIDIETGTAELEEKICRIRGIGQWTARYIAMRALHDPDAFPHGDLVLRRAAATAGQTLTHKQLLERAEAWRPWRAYAALLLWRHHQAMTAGAAKTAQRAGNAGAKNRNTQNSN